MWIKKKIIALYKTYIIHFNLVNYVLILQANFASWEPKHGKFSFRHPWKQYLKIGSLTRQCAYQIESLNGYVNPTDIQVIQTHHLCNLLSV